MIAIVLSSLLILAPVINGDPVGLGHSTKAAKEARQLVHQANWTTVAPYFSSGGNVRHLAISDSNIGDPSTGDIFFCLPERFYTGMAASSNGTLIYFGNEDEDDNGGPIWSATVLISGRVKKVEPGTQEYVRGKEAYQSRHPTVRLNESGDLFLCKVDIANVLVEYGQNEEVHVTPQQYYSAQ